MVGQPQTSVLMIPPKLLKLALYLVWLLLFYHLKYVLINVSFTLALLQDMSMLCHWLYACCQYNVTLLAMNKTLFCWSDTWSLRAPTHHQTWTSCGQGLACKLRFEVICSQLHVKCQNMTRFFFLFFPHRPSVKNHTPPACHNWNPLLSSLLLMY